MGTPPNGGAECKGGMKKSRFSTNIGLYLGIDATKKCCVNTTKNVNDYNNVRSEIRVFVLELFSCQL